MTTRQERGRAIAATQKLEQRGKVWLVPSQSGPGKYTVVPDDAAPYCSCKDHEEGGDHKDDGRVFCKHIYAVQFTMSRTVQEVSVDGTVKTTTETLSVKTTAER